ncbi:MAG: nitrite reductase large subunit NirB [Elusimicrobia bacterium]|nr:NAD(P)/FAD-dependent oxidoreductase [Elusimicrobiota bacterium]MBP9127270.1 nitrite reductase large subunit NirB [Elusimicrobiota bacterium]MBP9698794.1 nitrite reductase large subunit NirB [Elusimicrobiota bacterium]
MQRKRLVVIGNGMAGMACLDHILRRKPHFQVTVLGEEPHPNYNRILLSSVLAGEKSVGDIFINTPAWYEENGVALLLNAKVTEIDRARKTVTAGDKTLPYDLLLLATGSLPVIPPIQDAQKDGVFVFRNIADTENIIARAGAVKKAAVIGGGLLGLEAARGLQKQGLQVTVIHNGDTLMSMQVDETGGKFLKREIEKLGINVLLDKTTERFLGNGHVQGVQFRDGAVLDTDLVVIACGIRPNVELARKAGLTVNRGIVVSDHLETSDPSVFAVGECVEHRGVCYGLVAPLYDQGRVLAAAITGEKGPPYEGSTPASKLKVMGIELFSAGIVRPVAENTDSVTYEDHLDGVYKKVLLENNRIVGTLLIGDAKDANRFLERMRKKEIIGRKHNLLFEPPVSLGSAEDVMSRSDSETLCGCVGVTKGTIIEAVREKQCKSVSDVKACTRATSGCGTCAGLVSDILKAVLGHEMTEEKKKDVVCACVPFSQPQLRTMIQTQKLKSVQDILDIYGNGAGCSTCKPALSFILDEALLGDHLEDRSARFINDRVHANIQKDGSFSVVPRMRGGVTSAAELRKIADVADKFKVKMVKVTGSQRIDLLGVKKEDLPKMWAELGMPSGHAYAKAVRMVKSCVGTDFCRYGTQNSIETGIRLERTLEGLYTPAKVKFGVVGCPRNCAEATVKDIGLVGIEGGWQVVIGGAAGKRVRPADILTTVATTDDAMETACVFFQYYRENGNYLERVYDFVERVGLQKIREETVLASPEMKKSLLDRLSKGKEKVVDPWAVESSKPVHPMQFNDFVLPKEKEALVIVP